MLPRQFDKYELRKELGRGAFGTVYLARQEALDRDVAIKILLPEASHDKGFIDRFKREAKMAASLRHPNIVQVFDAARVQDEYYITMEFIDGQNLREMLDSGYKPDWKESIDVCLQILQALKHAHGKKIIHRDIKPANILVEKPDRVVLTDFSIAHMKDASRLTTTGHYLGTPEYISPEILEGGEVAPPTDLYAVGLILYEMVTGIHPFRGSSVPQVIKAQLFNVPQSPDELNPQLPRSVAQVINQALAKDARKRPQTAEEMSKLLLQARNQKVPVVCLGPVAPAQPLPKPDTDWATPAPAARLKLEIKPATEEKPARVAIKPALEPPLEPRPRPAKVEIKPFKSAEPPPLEVKPEPHPAETIPIEAEKAVVTIDPGSSGDLAVAVASVQPELAAPLTRKMPKPPKPGRLAQLGRLGLLLGLLAATAGVAWRQYQGLIKPAAVGQAKGTIFLQAEPERLMLSINGRPPREHHSGDQLQLDAGDYTLKASQSGYREREFKLSLKPDQVARVPLRLEAQSARLVIKGDFSDVNVTVDGQVSEALGQLPRTFNLAVGNHTLSFSRPHYEPVEATFELADQDEKEYELAMSPLKATLEIDTRPAYCLVFINGERRGKAPLTVAELAPGPVTVKLTRPGFEDKTVTITLAPEERQKQLFTLTPRPKPKPAPRAPAAPPRGYDPGPAYVPPPPPPPRASSGGSVLGDQI